MVSPSETIRMLRVSSATDARVSTDVQPVGACPPVTLLRL